MRKGSNRDEIDARLGDFPNVVERDTTGRLEAGPPTRERHRLHEDRRAHVVEQDRVRARFQGFLHLFERVALDLDGGSRRLSPVDRGGDRAGEPQMVVLDQDPVVEPETMVRAAAAPHSVFLDSPQPRCGLPRVEDRRAGTGDRLDVAPCQGRYPRQAAEQIEGQPLAAQERARAAREAGDLALEDFAVRGQRLEPGVRVELDEDGAGELQAAGDAGLLEEDRRFGECVLGNDRLGRQIAGAEVLGEPVADVDGRQLHGSKTGSWPGRRTVCKPASAGSSCRKSARKWLPRLSRRTRALRAIMPATGCGERASRSSPTAPGGFVVRFHNAAAPPVASRTARAETARRSVTTPTQRPSEIQRSSASSSSLISIRGSPTTASASTRAIRCPVAAPSTLKMRCRVWPPSSPSSSSKPTPSSTRSAIRAGASCVRASTALARERPRPARIVSAA